MVEPLVMPFVVVVRDELAHGATQRALAEQDHALEAGVLDGTHEALRVGVQVTWNDERIRAAAGGHVGADVAYMVTSVFGLGGFVRFATGSVDIPIATAPVPVDVGGVQTGGIRIRF